MTLRSLVTLKPIPGRDYLTQIPVANRLIALLAACLGLVSFVLFYGLVAQILILAGWPIFGHGMSAQSFLKKALAYEIPWGLVGVHLGIASIIPIAAFAYYAMLRIPASMLISVTQRIRWRLLLVTLIIAIVTINGAFLLRQSWPLELHPQPEFFTFMLIVLFTSPIQAIAEEVFFRGYLSQLFGAFFGNAWPAIITSAAVFALMHGIQNPPLFIDRFAFGLLAGILVYKTGGLEAGIAAHIVNNVFAFMWAGLMTSIAQVKATQSIDWAQAVFDVSSFAVFAGVAYLASRRLDVTVVVPDKKNQN